MHDELSETTRAVLLLTAPLLAGRNRPTARLLTGREYRRLARCLHAAGAEPGDLLRGNAAALIRECASDADDGRLESLLGRGLLLAQAVDRWRSRSIWVVTRGDAAYPRALRERLRDDAPSVLYGCGSPALWRPGGLAIVGSRDLGPESIDYAASQAGLAAQADRIVVSGAARGADRAALDGAAAAGGVAVGVLPSDLERTALTRRHRDLVKGERLLLLSPFDPNARFNVGYAMARNKVIYALADAALVVEADAGKGGTWNGAVEQIEKYGTPIYVRGSGGASAGLDALLARGAKRWPDPADADALSVVIDEAPQTATTPETSTESAKPDSGSLDEAAQTATAPQSGQGALFDDAAPPQDRRARGDLQDVRQILDDARLIPDTETKTEAAREQGAAETPDRAEQLYRYAANLIREVCVTSASAKSIATVLGVPSRTAEGWIKRMVEEDLLEKRTRPVRYVTRPDAPPARSRQ